MAEMMVVRPRTRKAMTTKFAVVCVVAVLAASSTATAQVRTPSCDSSPSAVQQDEASLRDTIAESLLFLFDGDRTRRDALAATIEVTYVGAGRMMPAAADSLPRPAREPGAVTPQRITGWIGINPATCNQFRIRLPSQTARGIAAGAVHKGFGRAEPGPASPSIVHPPDGALEMPDQYCAPQTGPYFSGCLDTRRRSGTLTYPERTITNFSSDGQLASCTGTLVGPRHILTAGHCLYQGNNVWNDFTVIPGRDGAYWPFGSTQMSDTQGLNQGFRWYWIPEAAFEAPLPEWFTGLDIGIIVIPKRLGDVVGWMGVVARADAGLTTAANVNKGYPAGSGGPIGFHPVQLEGAMYGDYHLCSVGDYSHHDAQGWGRIAGHSCDNSSGHSGGPIYHSFWDSSVQATVPAVSLIISHYPAFVSDFDCEHNPRPYSATRITPEYIDWFLFFRSWKP